MSRSSKASRYGSLAEKHLADERGLVLDGQHTSWCDARFHNGTPVEIKSAMVSTGYFQIYRKYHEKLRDAGGWYGFVVYREHGDGIRVLKTRMARPERLPLQSLWSPTGGHRNSEKAKINIGEVIY
ncbi:hypothetical protein [Haloarchaeobius sp. FL176]|uniref:hypothetical protein n=1 Tax=Haloarchaeobius sp. FL176 TaxID=2967129 RepID=UPI002148BFC5|nr:hypothetical protein [Haloarchaeobius sp. FL176]